LYPGDTVEVMTPRAHGPFSAGEQSARTDLGGMAAEVRRQHILKCFELSNARALLARVIEFARSARREMRILPGKTGFPSWAFDESV
jgi:hypothetical protein